MNYALRTHISIHMHMHNVMYITLHATLAQRGNAPYAELFLYTRNSAMRVRVIICTYVHDATRRDTSAVRVARESIYRARRAQRNTVHTCTSQPPRLRKPKSKCCTSQPQRLRKTKCKCCTSQPQRLRKPNLNPVHTSLNGLEKLMC